FITVDDLVNRLLNVLQLPDIIHYDADTDELTLDLSIGDPDSINNLGFLDVPLNFDLLDLAPIAELSSDSTIRLSAGGGLTLTLGLYLGNEGAVDLSDDTELSTLKDGITFSDLQSISTGADITTVVGQLFDDAQFKLAIN